MVHTGEDRDDGDGSIAGDSFHSCSYEKCNIQDGEICNEITFNPDELCLDPTTSGDGVLDLHQENVAVEDEASVSRILLEIDDAATKEVDTEAHGDDDVKVPDGGYGWFVVLSSFLSHVLIGGLERSDGVFFLVFESRFGHSAAVTAWPGAIASMVRLFMGPISSAVCQQWSVRACVMVGGLLLGTVHIISAYSPNLYFLFISHGFLQGVFRGLMYAPSLVIVSMYFDNRRSIATGLAASGVGMGTLVVVPLIQFLFDTYGFEGGFLLLSAVCYNGLVMAMLYRPLFLHYRYTADNRKLPEKPSTSDVVMLAELSDAGDTTSVHSVRLRATGCSYNSPASSPARRIKNSHTLKGESEGCSDQGYGEIGRKGKGHGDAIDKDNDASQIDKKTSHRLEGHECLTKAQIVARSISQYDTQDLKSHSLHDSLVEVQRNDCQIETNERRTRGCMDSSTMEILLPRHPNTTEPGEKKPKLFHFYLLRDPAFFSFCLSIGVFTATFKAAFTFLPALAKAQGLSSAQGIFVLSISGLVDTFGRIIAGFVMDIPRLKRWRQIVYALVMALTATLCALMPIIGSSFVLLCLICSGFGMLTGLLVSQKSVLCVDLLGLKLMPSAFGIMLVFQGVGVGLGPLLAGACRDWFGRFHEAFYLGGVLMLVASLLMVYSSVRHHRHQALFREMTVE